METTSLDCLEELFNAHLINDGLRRAFLKSPVTKETMIYEILKMYPKLKVSEKNIRPDGTIVGAWWLSKRKIPEKDIDNDEKIGHVLGYKTIVRHSERDYNSRGYWFRIRAYTKFGRVNIMSVSDAVPDLLGYYEDLAKQFEKSLKSMPIYGETIKEVRADLEIEYTNEEVISMLSNWKKKYLKDDGLKFSIKKYMSKELGEYTKTLDLEDPLHRGILIGLRASTMRWYLEKLRMIPFEDRKEFERRRLDLLVNNV